MATVENRGPIADCFTKTMIEKINGSNEAESVRAAELALCPSWSLPSSRKQKRVTGATYELLSDISNQVVESCAPRISELCPRDYGICFEWLIRGRTSIPELVAWHGVRALFRDCHHQMFRFRYYSPLVALLTYRLVFGWFPEKEKEVFPHWLKAASDAAGYIIEHPTPWTPLNDFLTLEDWELTQPGPPPSWVSGLERDPTPLFFCLAVLALMVESTALGEDPKDLLVWLKGVNTPTVKLLRPLLIARLEEQKADQIQSKMDELRFTKSQQKFIWSWIRRERDLVGPPVDDEGGPLAGGAPLTR